MHYNTHNFDFMNEVTAVDLAYKDLLFIRNKLSRTEQLLYFKELEKEYNRIKLKNDESISLSYHSIRKKLRYMLVHVNGLRRDLFRLKCEI